MNHHADRKAVGTNSDEKVLTCGCLSQVLIYTDCNISAQYTFFTLPASLPGFLASQVYLKAVCKAITNITKIR